MVENKDVYQKLVFRKLIRKDVSHLMNSGFSFSKSVIDPPIVHKLVHAARLIPREMGLVAFHVKDKKAIGHLKLFKHTNSLYSIKCVFTNPNYRKMGVASGLINYAFILAKNAGGKKIFLTANPQSNAGRLYSKLGFRPIINTSTILTAGFPKSQFEDKYRLFSLDMMSKKNKQIIYDLYEKYLGSKWVDFFETRNEIIFNGFSQDFQRLPFKVMFINNLKNSFALVSNNVIFSKATVELYTASDDLVDPMLKGLFQLLRYRGVVTAKLTLFNIKASKIDHKNFDLLKEMSYAYALMFMGKIL